MSVTVVPFGQARDGRAVEKVILRAGALEVEIMTLGATVLALRVPDKAGQMTDVVLGYRTAAAYEENEGYLGALVGRYANRIAGARFSINGEVFRLTANEGSKQLHGGPTGFSFRHFSVERSGEDTAVFRYTSPDGENGFPGTLVLSAAYTLTERGLRIRYEAVSDRDTWCNLTNHSYFNLDGGGSAMDHMLWIDAEEITPVDGESLPTAERMAVAGTAFDFTAEKRVGAEIGAAEEQLRNTGGYDHNFILRAGTGLRPAARLRGGRSGIAMEVWTDKPGVQFYSGNYLSTTADTKAGRPYRQREGLCLETQFPPDSPNHGEWGDRMLRKGARYCFTTEYRFL